MSRDDRYAHDYRNSWTAFVARWEYLHAVVFARIAVRACRRDLIVHRSDTEVVRRAARVIAREFRA